MSLIFLSTLASTNSLAAVRFSRPVHVSSLRIIPSSLAPFPSLADFSSETEPASFSLDVFFNWQTLPSGNEKPRPSNVLLHSTLQNAGNELQYEIDSSEEVLVTRLLILKGAFSSITLAVYGRDASEPKKEDELEMEESYIPAPTYVPVPLPEPLTTPLPADLDPSRITDPLTLCRRLLGAGSANADVISLMRRNLNAFPPSSNNTTLDQLLSSYEIGDDWMRELIQALQRPINPSDVTSEALQNIEEHLLECITQSLPAELIGQLISVLSVQSSVLVDSLLPLILESATDPSIYPTLLEASANDNISDSIRHVKFPPGLDPAIYHQMNQNAHMWEALREGETDLSWITANMWLPGFLPSILEVLGDTEDLSAWPLNAKLAISVASLLALATDSDNDIAAMKAAAILELWLANTTVVEVLHEALEHQNIQENLSSSPARSLLEKVHSVAVSLSNQRNGTSSSINGHGGTSVPSGDLDMAAEYLTLASKRWPAKSTQQLQAYLQTLYTRVAADRDSRPITHAFWRRNTSAVQCIILLLLDATRRLSDQNWELSDATSARDLVATALLTVRILHHMVPEFGILSGMVPLVIRALVSLLISLRQPTYATRYATEPTIRAECERLVELISDVDDDGIFVHSGADVILPVLLQESLRWDEGIDPMSRISASADLLIVLLNVDHSSKARSQAWANQLIHELPMLHFLLIALDGSRLRQIVDIICDIDDGEFGIVDWLVLERLASIEQEASVVGTEYGQPTNQVSTAFFNFRVERSLEFMTSLGLPQLDAYMEPGHPIAPAMAKGLWEIWDRPIKLSNSLAEQILSRSTADDTLRPVAVAILIATNSTSEAGNAIIDVLPKLVPLLNGLESSVVQKEEQLLRAVGAAIAFLPELEEQITVEWQRGEVTLEFAITLLQTTLGFFPNTDGVITGIPVPTLSEGTAARFKGLVEVLLDAERALTLTKLLTRLSLPLISTPLPEPASSSLLIGSALPTLVQAEVARPPSTPLSRPLSGLDGGVKTAPPSARKSSPLASLAKNYSNNDFRELRTLPQARLNTSRPPSRHVDDFEHTVEEAVTTSMPSAIPTLGSAALPSIPVPGVLPGGGMPFYTG
ncbi:hypothetical protein DACRYDRAFT_103440 [Dacryopinax primogenitus]|uniref:Virilizer N-terminal domain-containing protein n=1 Tax=Dacryopinax primogenitus (strain DJM 731) TaxID=1858805 RepID=M5GH24_DACPD|nr:uncharacterized protein DACRYDRAFT_103440 [Dacryopinax primogenitus]EJU06493.1 hypothetical protein DACRYDRAFT_103440 [Dacryopinax primogenitus]